MAFDQFDKEGNGNIQVYEIKGLLKEIGYPCSDEEILEIVEKADSDGWYSI